MNWNASTNFLNLLQNRIIRFLIIAILITSPVWSQTKVDSLTSNKSDTSKFVMQKSPTGAMLRSMVFPGWGQLYNESYWKVPVIWAAFGYFAYIVIDQNKLYKEYSGYVSDPPDASKLSTYTKYMNFYRDQRDQFILYLALTYLVNIADAYIDAHMFDFDVSEKDNVRNYSLKIKIGL